MTVRVLADKGVPRRQIARQMGIDESTVRYQLQQAARASEDGRRNKPRKAEAVAAVIAHWFERHDGPRPVNVRDLYDHLVEEHGYAGSYRSVLRYVRAEYPRPRVRTYRRVETPPGAQCQTDWGEFPRVDIGDGAEPLHAFLMVLSHSRKPALVWARNERLPSWLGCHNEAFRRLGGIPAVNRIDNLKTAIMSGAGATGQIHPAYRAYAQQVGFHIDACPPRQGNAKGKVESKVRLGRLRANPTRRFDGLEDLQDWSDRRLERWASKAICPATGRTVHDSWQAELEQLAPLPRLPEPFDVAVTRHVHKDCMIRFEGRSYAVPFAYVGQQVEVRGCDDQVQIWADGRLVRDYPRHTDERILIDTSCYEGPPTERAWPPAPLGRMGKRLQEIYDMPVQQRPLDLYAALTEVAR